MSSRRSSSKHSVGQTHGTVASQSSSGCFSGLSKSRSLRKMVAPLRSEPSPLPAPVPTTRTPQNAAIPRQPPPKNTPETPYLEQPIVDPPPSLDTVHSPSTSGYTRPKAERRVHAPSNPYTNGPVSKQGAGYFAGPPPPPTSEPPIVCGRPLQPNPSRYSRRRP